MCVQWFTAQAAAQSVPTAARGSGALRAAASKGLQESDFVPLMRKLTRLPDHELMDLMDLLGAAFALFQSTRHDAHSLP